MVHTTSIQVQGSSQSTLQVQVQGTVAYVKHSSPLHQYLRSRLVFATLCPHDLGRDRKSFNLTTSTNWEQLPPPAAVPRSNGIDH